ncbi:unnamed protein product [Cylicocyclus nassatus]|uniref:Ubiquitin-like domain-containing protein n=1 Tax=Cylicocyclus nassatus TaxID=53992 RepID=A0AA36GUP2_CYLNA|nr:unnamed protein product [Cylicocyclus nassatus]
MFEETRYENAKQKTVATSRDEFAPLRFACPIDIVKLLTLVWLLFFQPFLVYSVRCGAEAPILGMLEIEGFGSEVVTAFFVVAASLTVLLILVSAWRLTGRRPLFYDLFLVEIHSWDARRFVQVLQLGQEFRPRGSWGDVMTRMRTRARVHSQSDSAEGSGSSHRISDTNVVIQSPATVMDDTTTSVPSPSASTLWEIEMPPSGSSGGDVSHESHFAAAAAIAVLGRGGLQVGNTSSGTMDVVPGATSGASLGVSAVGVSSVGGELNSNSFTVEGQRPHGVTNIVMPMNISVVNDELESNEVEVQVPAVDRQPVSDTVAEDTTTNSNPPDVVEEPREEVSLQTENPEAEGDSVIRLKFLDDTQRDARTTMTDTIGKFKSVHFGDAVAAGRIVRLIYQGQLLREDSRTLASYGLRDGCVVHCHISNTPYATQGPSTSQSNTAATQLRHRDNVRPTQTTAAEPTRVEADEFRYPRWAVALLLNTYRFPLIGLPLDAIVRFLFDRQSETAAQPGLVRRTYRRLLAMVYREENDDVSPLDRAADAAARVPPPRLCLGDYLLWIFAGQFVAVWGFVYAFPQLCDHTALGLLVLLTLYFLFVVCRSREQHLAEIRPVDRPNGVSTNSDR